MLVEIPGDHSQARIEHWICTLLFSKSPCNISISSLAGVQRIPCRIEGCVSSVHWRIYGEVVVRSPVRMEGT